MMAAVSVARKGVGVVMMIGLLGAAGNLACPGAARATGDQPFIGEISCGGWTFCPNGWAECAGQLLPIAENDNLFNLIGTTYGGDGESTFAMPNLSGRTMLGTGTGAGANYTQGEAAGNESVTLTTNQIPTHTHALNAQTATGDSASPTDKVVAGVAADDARYATAATTTATLNSAAVGVVGGSQPHNNLQPYLTVKCCISLFGIFPQQ